MPAPIEPTGRPPNQPAASAGSASAQPAESAQVRRQSERIEEVDDDDGGDDTDSRKSSSEPGGPWNKSNKSGKSGKGDDAYGEYESYEGAHAFEYGSDRHRDELIDCVDDLRYHANVGRKEIGRIASHANALWQKQIEIESELAIATDKLKEYDNKAPNLRANR